MKTVFSSILVLLLVLGACKKKNSPIPPDSNAIGPKDFLSETNYTKLIVEIDYMSGYEPTAASIQSVVAFLQSRINKPMGIEVVKNVIAAGGRSFYSLKDIIELERSHRGQLTQGNVLTVYVLFLDNNYGDPKVLGVNYFPSSIAIFERTIRDHSGGLTKPSTQLLETTVIEHEFGHVLGLTNNGTGMQSAHQDSAHGAHCNNTDCLMYYAVETTDILGSLFGSGTPPALDAGCLNDLQANGGK